MAPQTVLFSEVPLYLGKKPVPENLDS